MFSNGTAHMHGSLEGKRLCLPFDLCHMARQPVLLLLLLLLLQDLLDPRRIQAGRCSSHDVAQLVTFRSKQQAAQRAGKVGIHTNTVTQCTKHSARTPFLQFELYKMTAKVCKHPVRH
jgi:hypothetical protein